MPAAKQRSCSPAMALAVTAMRKSTVSAQSSVSGSWTTKCGGRESPTPSSGRSSYGAESCVIVNLVKDTTYEPQTDQSFVADAWITGVFNLDVPAYLTRAAETVEKLNGPKVAKIIVEG